MQAYMTQNIYMDSTTYPLCGLKYGPHYSNVMHTMYIQFDETYIHNSKEIYTNMIIILD